MNARDYVGIPFLMRGRTREGCDCWGLVRLVLAEEWGLEVPFFDGYDSHRDLRALRDICDTAKPLLGADRVDGPAPGIVVLMFVRSYPAHVGICVDDLHLLHIEYGCNSVYQRIDQVRPRIEGFYRIRGMA